MAGPVRRGGLLALLLLSGCITVQSSVRVVAPDQVDDCRYLADVTGSGFGGLFAGENARRAAEQEALDAAEELGATHVAWYSSEAGFVSSVAGRAYRCPRAPKEAP